ncbi:MAG: hypothetical protein AAF532_01455 [Planctomycetota bacterium]
MKRLQVGVFAAAVVGVAALLNGLLNGFGLGAGAGGTGGEATSEVSVALPPSEPLTLPDQVEPPQPADTSVVEVLVDDRSYYLRDGEGWAAASLEDVTAAATAATGSDGVKLRVVRSDAARASAEEELLDALAAAGLDRTAIVIAEGFVTR